MAEVMKGYVPIDTGLLQESIVSSVLNEKAIVQVPDITLHYDGSGKGRNINALKLALILEVGRGNKALLKRTQSNVYPGTSEGKPTAKWFEFGEAEILRQLQPIADEIILKVFQQIARELSSNGL